MAKQKYRKVWEQDEILKDWIRPHYYDDTKAICCFCKSEILARYNDLRRHSKTYKHIKFTAKRKSSKDNIVSKQSDNNCYPAEKSTTLKLQKSRLPTTIIRPQEVCKNEFSNSDYIEFITNSKQISKLHDIKKILCRACMSTKCSKLYSIYSTPCPEYSVKIIEMLHAISAIPTSTLPKDDLPESICNYCLDELKISFDFQQKCINSYNYLKSIINDAEPPKSQIFSEKSIENTNQVTLQEEVSKSPSYGNSNSDDAMNLDLELTPEEYAVHVKSGDIISKMEYEVVTSESELQEINSNSSSEQALDENLYYFEYETDTEINTTTSEEKNHYDVRNKKESQPEKSNTCNSVLCPECGKTFKSSYCLGQHLKRHKGIKKYQCPECPSKFLLNSTLKIHMSTHSQLRPFVCDICNSSFARSFTLAQHKQIHSDFRPHVCRFCEKRFNRLDLMKRHERTHTGERPYKCEFCEKAFSQSNDLVKHKRIHVGKNIYKCQECTKSFRLHSQLKLHNQEHFKQKNL